MAQGALSPKPLQTPKTVATPRKPISKPKIWWLLIFSCLKNNIIANNVVNGVVELTIPAKTDVTFVCASAINVPGITFVINASANTCNHNFRSRGILIFLIKTIIQIVVAPKKQRRKETPTGFKNLRACSIKRKEQPQKTPIAKNRCNHFSSPPTFWFLLNCW